MLTTIAGLAATAAASQPTSQPQSTANRIIEVDKRLNRAILAHDVASAAPLYDDDFLLTVSGGGFKRKSHMLADIGNAAVVLSVCETTNIEVRIRGGTAVLTGTLLQAGTVNGRALDVKLHVTDTWVNIDGQWLLLAGHASLAK